MENTSLSRKNPATLYALKIRKDWRPFVRAVQEAAANPPAGVAEPEDSEQEDAALVLKMIHSAKALVQNQPSGGTVLAQDHQSLNQKILRAFSMSYDHRLKMIQYYLCDFYEVILFFFEVNTTQFLKLFMSNCRSIFHIHTRWTFC